jgi:phage repressor protein C with HTH and peptisase S24 domain
MDIRNIFARIQERLEIVGLKESRASTAAGLSPDAIRNIRRQIEAENFNATVSLRTLTALAPILGVSVNWLVDGDGEASPVRHGATTARPKPNASFPPQFQSFAQDRLIPLMGQIEAGPNGKFVMNGQKIADIFCPPGLENVPNAYAVRVYGTSMEPRYKAGETVWLNPQAPVRSGDDVVVQLRPEVDGDEMASYIKEFRSRSSKVLRLWQHNPEEGEPKELEFENDDVFSVHKVVHHATV